MFNVIHYATALKMDIFMLKGDPLARAEKVGAATLGHACLAAQAAACELSELLREAFEAAKAR